MRAFIDAQALIWFGTGHKRTPVRVRRFIEDPTNELLLSIATIWEMMIKGRLGRFQFDQPPVAFVLHQIGALSLIPTAISMEHVFRVFDLPGFHQDPFDRLLIAQAMIENVPILTGDQAIERYDVQTIW